MATFHECEFRNNLCHIKLAQGGIEAYISHCAFYQSNLNARTLGGRIFIWVVPTSGEAGTGPGLVVADSSFGAESVDPTDMRILYADEIAGADFATNLPQLAADSTGFVVGHVVKNVSVWGGTLTPVPLIYSTTPNVYGGDYGPFTIKGNPPSYMGITYRTPPTAAFGANDRFNNRNTFGPFNWVDSTTEPDQDSASPAL